MTDDRPTTDCLAHANALGQGELPSGHRSGVLEAGESVPRFSPEFIEEIKRDCQANSNRAAHVLEPDDWLGTAQAEMYRRLELYRESDNLEYLIDVAKFSMWAWMFRREHP